MAKEESALAKLESEVIFEPSAIDSDAINQRMMRNIAEADNVDDILSANQTETLRLDDIEDENVTVEVVSFHESADEFAEGGWGFFAVMQLADGRAITTGAKTVVLKLYQISKVNGFPLSDVTFTAKRTRSGYRVWDVARTKTT